MRERIEVLRRLLGRNQLSGDLGPRGGPHGLGPYEQPVGETAAPRRAPGEPVPIIWVEPGPRKTDLQERCSTHDADPQPEGCAVHREEGVREIEQQADACKDLPVVDSVTGTSVAVMRDIIEAADLLVRADQQLWDRTRGIGDIPLAKARVELLEARILLSRAYVYCLAGKLDSGAPAHYLQKLAACMALAGEKLCGVSQKLESAGEVGNEGAARQGELKSTISEVHGRLARLNSLLAQAAVRMEATDLVPDNGCREDPSVKTVDNSDARSPTDRNTPNQNRQGVSRPRRPGSNLPRKQVLYPARIEIHSGNEGVGVYSRNTSVDKVRFPLHNPDGEKTSRMGDPGEKTIFRTLEEQSASKPPVPGTHADTPRRMSIKETEARPLSVPAVKGSELGLYSRPRGIAQTTPETEGEKMEIRRSDVDSYLIIEDLNTRGIELRRSGQYNEALSCFERILEIEPDHLAAWNNRGIALSKLGRLEEAVKCFDMVLTRAPSNAGVWMQRSLVLFQLERHLESLESLDQVLALEPDRGMAWRHRAGVLRKLGRISEASDSLERARLLDAKS